MEGTGHAVIRYIVHSSSRVTFLFIFSISVISIVHKLSYLVIVQYKEYCVTYSKSNFITVSDRMIK